MHTLQLHTKVGATVHSKHVSQCDVSSGLRRAAQEIRAEYGHDEHNFYAADTFNEMDPGTNDPAYLRNASSAVYNVRNLAFCCTRGNGQTPWACLTTILVQ